MMRTLGIDLKITAKKSEILAKLYANREQHTRMVAEAREGYIKQARERLAAALDELATGKLVSLAFRLSVPKDFTRLYTTTIAQLEAHQGDTIELSTSEFNMLMEDEWEWVRDFVTSNSSYSG